MIRLIYFILYYFVLGPLTICYYCCFKKYLVENCFRSVFFNILNTLIFITGAFMSDMFYYGYSDIEFA